MEKLKRFKQFSKDIKNAFGGRLISVIGFGSIFRKEADKYLGNDCEIIIALEQGNLETDVAKVRNTYRRVKTCEVQLQILYRPSIAVIKKFYSFHTGWNFLINEINRDGVVLFGQNLFLGVKQVNSGLMKVDAYRKIQQYLDQLVTYEVMDKGGRKIAYLYLKRCLSALKDYLYFFNLPVSASGKQNLRDIIKQDPAIFDRKMNYFLNKIIKTGPAALSKRISWREVSDHSFLVLGSIQRSFLTKLI